MAWVRISAYSFSRTVKCAIDTAIHTVRSGEEGGGSISTSFSEPSTFNQSYCCSVLEIFHCIKINLSVFCPKSYLVVPNDSPFSKPER